MYLFNLYPESIMASTPQKDAIVFILDVNPSLWQIKSESTNGKKWLRI